MCQRPVKRTSTLSIGGKVGPFAHALHVFTVVLLALVLAACGLSDVVEPDDRPAFGDANEPVPVTSLVVHVEAEAVVDLGGFVVEADVLASAGRVLVQPGSVVASSVAVEAVFVPFVVEVAGEYSLWARVFAVDGGGDVLELGFDGGVERVVVGDVGRFVWVEVVRAWLGVGEHRVSVGVVGAGLRLDLFAVVAGVRPSVGELEGLVELVEPVVGDPPVEVVPGPGVEPEPDPVVVDPAPVLPPVDEGRLRPSLRGDPGFDGSQLSGAAGEWFERVLWEIDDSREGTNGAQALERAGSDCVYQYGRPLHTYVQNVLVAFRLTGDLRLLDHVDRITERMREELRDGWRGTADGTDGTQDGYRNWVRRRATNDLYQGKDTNMREDERTHSFIAMVAYALHVNRDLESPSGRDYGAHADFWLDYLVNDFEAKWRERRGVATGFPIMGRPHTHDYLSWAKWHHYMGLLTGDSAYTAEALRMADILWAELREVGTPSGTAYVWARSVLSLEGSSDYLMPTTYASMVYADVVELHLEGFHNWASSVAMERFARTVTELMRDVDFASGEVLASDIGGEVARAGIGSYSEFDASRWRRVTLYGLSGSNFPLISVWDASGVLLELTEASDRRGRVKSAVAAFMHAWYHDVDSDSRPVMASSR